MKKILIGLVVIAAIFLVVGILDDMGYLNVKWQTLAMILAAIAGPYKYIKDRLFSSQPNKKAQQVRSSLERLSEQEKIHRMEYDAEIEKRKQKIEELDEKIKDLELQIAETEKKKKQIDEEVDNMSVDDMQSEFVELFGE